MKSSIISSLLWFIFSVTVVYAQERPVEGIYEKKDHSISRIKLFENEQNELVLFIADTGMAVDLDSILEVHNYDDFTMPDSVNKLNDTIQQVVILENGQLEIQNVQIGLKLKKSNGGFNLKTEAYQNTNAIEEFANPRTLEINFKYWCMENNSFWDSKKDCEKDCPHGCDKRPF